MVTYFDIECVARDDVPEDCLPRYKPHAGIKDYDKQLAREKEFNYKSKNKLALDPWTTKIVCIQMLREDDEWAGYTGDKEISCLKMFWEVARDDEFLGGFNIIGYDLPVILVRSMIHNIKPVRKFRLNKYNHNVEDVMYRLCNGDLPKAKSLDYYVMMLGIGKKTLKGEEVESLYKDGKWDVIEEYCKKDVELTKALALKTQAYF